MAGPLDLRGTATVTNNASKSLRELQKDLGAVADAGSRGMRGLGQSFRESERAMGGMVSQLSRWNAETQRAQASSFTTRMGSWQKDMAAQAASMNLSAWESAGRRAGEAFKRGFGAFKAFDNQHGIAVGTMAGVTLGVQGKKLFQEAGSVEQERRLMAIAPGMKANHIREVEARAEEISAKYKSLPKANVMRTISELRMPLGDKEGAHHSMEVIEPLAKAQVILGNLTHIGKLHGVNTDEAGFDFVKAMELRGITSKEGMEHAIEMMMKSIVASGGQINAHDWHMVSKGMRGALNGLDDHYLYSVMPSLMQEFKIGGGSAIQAATAGLALYRADVSGKMTDKAATMREELGLLEPGTYEHKRNGGVNAQSLRPNSLKYGALAQSDPAAYMRLVKQRMEEKGITDEKEQARYLSQMYSNQVAEHMAQLLNYSVHMARVNKDSDMVDSVPPMDEMLKVLGDAPVQAMNEFGAQMKNLYAALGDPMLDTAVAGIKKITEAISGLTQLGQQKPGQAWGAVGGLGALAGIGMVALGLGLSRVPGGRMIGGTALGLGIGGSAGNWILGAILANQLFGGAAQTAAKGGVGAATMVPEFLGFGAAAGTAGATASRFGWLARLGPMGLRLAAGLGWGLAIGGGIGAIGGGYDAWSKGGSWGDVGLGALKGGFNGATLGLFSGSAQAGEVPKAAPKTSLDFGGEATLGALGQQAQDAQGQVSAATQGMVGDVQNLGAELQQMAASLSIAEQGRRIGEEFVNELRSALAAAAGVVTQAGHDIEAAAGRIHLNTGPMMRGAN